MGGFFDQAYTDRSRVGRLERRVDFLTTDDVFQPIVSLSTTDKKVVELLVGDRTMTGYFDSGCWMVDGGKTPMPEGLYPSHWRPLKPL